MATECVRTGTNDVRTDLGRRTTVVQAGRMLAVTAARLDTDDPLSGLEVGERPEPAPQPGWTNVRVRAAALNHHDLWTLKGVGIKPERLPIVLGGDAAGDDEDGNAVVVHAVIGDSDAGGG